MSSFRDKFYDSLQTRAALAGKYDDDIKKQEVNQIFHGKRINVEMPIIEHRPDFWQIDTAFYPLRGKTRAIFTAIEVNKKLGFIRPYKGAAPTGAETIEHLEKLRKTFPVQHIGADNGSEFIANAVQDYLDNAKVSIYYYTPYNSKEKAVIERFNGTVKNYLNKVSNAIDKDWTKFIDKIWNTYNETPHSSIGKAPIDMTERDVENFKFKQLMKAGEYLKVLQSFKPGDRVRVFHTADPNLTEKEKQAEIKFGKMNYPKWTKDIYEVEAIDGYKIRLRGLPMRFSPRDLQKITVVESTTMEQPTRREMRQTRLAGRVRNELGQDITKIVSHSYQPIESRGKIVGYTVTFLAEFEGLDQPYNIPTKDISNYNGKDALDSYLDSLDADEREKIIKYM